MRKVRSRRKIKKVLKFSTILILVLTVTGFFWTSAPKKNDPVLNQSEIRDQIDDDIEYLTDFYQNDTCEEKIDRFCEAMWYTMISHIQSNDPRYKRVSIDKTRRYLWGFKDYQKSLCPHKKKVKHGN